MSKDPRFKKAVFLVLQKLSYRPRSSSEITEYLKEKSYDEPIIREVIDHLARIGYVNDVEFADYWVEGRRKRKPIGHLALKRELEEKGLSEDLVEKIIEKEKGSSDEYGAARQVAMDRIKKMGDIDKRKAKKRVYDYLLRRGFEFDTVYKVLDEVFKG